MLMIKMDLKLCSKICSEICSALFLRKLVLFCNSYILYYTTILYFTILYCLILRLELVQINICNCTMFFVCLCQTLMTLKVLIMGTERVLQRYYILYLNHTYYLK